MEEEGGVDDAAGLAEVHLKRISNKSIRSIEKKRRGEGAVKRRT